MQHWIEQTALPMTVPAPYSPFHLLFSLIGILLAVFFAYIFSRHLQKKQLKILLFFCGILLAFSEVYKQLFLYYVVGQGCYDWWYFPFQLCSLPMYLCLILPFLHSVPVCQTICTFMQDFGLLGGIMALAEPTGLLQPYWFLTLHGLSWHIMLVFISLLICLGDLSQSGSSSYLHTLPMLAIFCIIATIINLATGGRADMFYIAPYYPVTQIIFHFISIHCGIAVGIMLYLISICIGGFLCHAVLEKEKQLYVRKRIKGKGGAGPSKS